MTPAPNTSRPICVTGASGFIAAHIVEGLLNAGYRVRGTVRDAASAKYDYLRSMAGADKRLELVSADLNEPASFEEAVAGCEYVLHTASPYALHVEDPQRDLVDPAVNGTRGVLEACQKAGSIRRVVLTSSMAAITDRPDERRVLTEADWNKTSSLTRNPYFYSKTMAEREAWRFILEEEPIFDLVAINPFVVIGPSHTDTLNPSNRLFAELLNGIYPMTFRLAWGFVDVRDVAEAHRLAFETPDASGRYICANATLTMRDLVGLLRAMGYGDYKLPRFNLDNPVGDAIVRLGSYFQPKGIRSYLQTHLGRAPAFDNGKIRRELGLTFRPLEETIRDAVEDVLRWGHVSS